MSRAFYGLCNKTLRMRLDVGIGSQKSEFTLLTLNTAVWTSQNSESEMKHNTQRHSPHPHPVTYDTELSTSVLGGIGESRALVSLTEVLKICPRAN
jgi:hypothetical protein